MAAKKILHHVCLMVMYEYCTTQSQPVSSRLSLFWEPFSVVPYTCERPMAIIIPIVW